MTDLFATETKSKKEQLLDYIKSIHYARTSQILAWGVRNFCNRADRNARQLATEGRIKRISEEEKIFRFEPTKEDIWQFISLTPAPKDIGEE